MIKCLLVLAVLIVACNAYAEDNALKARCTGMAAALELPDKNVFKAFMEQEQKLVQEKYGNYSEKHVEQLRIDAGEVGYGIGYMKGFLFGQGKDTALKTFMGYCWNDNYTKRNKILADLDFLQNR